ncbi:BAI1-associated protein 3-like [Watersipora subatra]|uniref:BAI1-associated protein 3-like n=1 Tax=Watersipora subatra TaxID=2589382 RepID=UPI00355C24AD
MSVIARGKKSFSCGPKRLRFLHSQSDSDETLTADTLSIYSSESIKDLDGRFFEYFSTAHQHGSDAGRASFDSVDGETIAKEAKRRPTLTEDLLKKLNLMENEAIKELSKKQKETLYSELLYTVEHKIGAESQSNNEEANWLYAYAKKAFKISDEQHTRLLEVTNKAKPPVVILNVVVEEARNLEAKDANGFSDPYCMLGIIPGSRLIELSLTNQDAASDPSSKEFSKSKSKSMLRKFSGSLRDKIRMGPREKPQHIIPAKFIRSTKFIPHNLNPVWNERFRFDLEDVMTDKIHIDVWDHDDEESVFDAAKTLNHAKSFKGLGRVFKQIAQSARASSGDNVDDFLGCIDVPLHDLPSTGNSQWYDLCGRSARSKVQGQIKVSLNLATREDHGFPIDDNFNDMQQHEDLLYIFIAHEREEYEGEPEDWLGILSKEADVILHQHSVQGDITPAQEAFCYWITFSAKYRECNFDASCLLNIVKSLEEKWCNGCLSGEEEARLGKSFEKFLGYFLDVIEELRGMYPSGNTKSRQQLKALLECAHFLSSSKVYNHCCSPREDMSIEIAHRLKMGNKAYFNHSLPFLFQQEETPVKEKIRELTNFTNLLSLDLRQGLRSYEPLFQAHLRMPYFDHTYRVLEKKLSSEVRKFLDRELSSLLLSSEVLTRQEIRRCSNQSIGRQPPPMPATHARHLLIASVLNLYFAVQEFSDFREELLVEDNHSLAISRYQEWFSRTVQEWLTLAKSRMEARIEMAVQQDKFVNIEDSFECSTSAMDVVNCYTQIAQFWKRLRWQDEEELFAFSLKLADDLCQSAILYTDFLHAKMKKNSYFDNEGQFDVQKPLCTSLNDLEYIKRILVSMPEKLDLPKVVAAIERKHAMGGVEDQPNHFQSVFESLIDSAQMAMDSKIEYIAKKVSDMMRPEIKKNVFHLCWSPDKIPVLDAIEPLIDYLDSNLLTLYTYLLRRNFKIILAAIWQECLEEIQEVIEENPELEACFCLRMLQALEILIDFFNSGDKGLLVSEIESKLYLGLKAYLTIQRFTTPEIICQFFTEMVERQKIAVETEEVKLGVIGFTVYYERAIHQLHVKVCHCKHIIALDSNGLSDPYIVWDLCPRHLFTDCDESRTSIKKKTLNPVYNEKFSCQLAQEDFYKEGACMRFTLMDYNFVVKNDFGGEAYFPLSQVPGGPGHEDTHNHKKVIELVFMKPHAPSENRHLLALKNRVSDPIAQEFVNNREDLAEQAKSKIEAFDAMTASH